LYEDVDNLSTVMPREFSHSTVVFAMEYYVGVQNVTSKT